MKISTRLSGVYSIIASSIFIVFGITIYLFSSRYREHNFQERLNERVLITEKMFLEKDSFSSSEFEKITNEFLHTLPEETEEVLMIQNNDNLNFKYEYPQYVKDKMVSSKKYDFKTKEVQGASRIFRVGSKDYLIIVTAIDKVGLQQLTYLKNIIIILVLFGIPLILLTSFMVTKRALIPLSRKINHANAISASNINERLKVYNPNDEIGKLAIAFNLLLDRLEASFVSQKSFIANASHEIKNPITAIMGEAEIAISKTRTKEEYVDSLKVILNESEILNSTVINLLHLSKITANEESVQFETIQGDEFLKEIKENFDFLNPNNQITLTITSGSKKDAFTIFANRNLLKTALINLLDNACKFSSNGNIEVVLSKDSFQLGIVIIDQGIGIAQNDIEKVITPFYRGNNAIKTKGSGIGLTLSSKIINLHNGELQIKSQIDKGTEVRVKLPLLT